MSCFCKLDKDEHGKNVDQNLYRSMIESLFYLTVSRLDIIYSVCICGRFQSATEESHLSVVKRIIKYVGTYPKLGLQYPKGSNLIISVYSDADLTRCKIDRESTLGTCQLLSCVLISWYSNKKHTMALSIVEAEYVALGSYCAQILWMKQ